MLQGAHNCALGVVQSDPHLLQAHIGHIVLAAMVAYEALKAVCLCPALNAPVDATKVQRLLKH